MSLKLNIFTEESSSKEVTLRLIEEDGAIAIVNVDSDGDTSNYLISINSDGKVYFHGGIDEDLGFPLDDDGELTIDE